MSGSRWLPLAAFALALWATPGRPQDAAPACGDFLAKAAWRPATLHFVDCEKLEIYGAPALRAHYRTSGADAAAVEALLSARTHMPPLRFNCCGWETAPASPKSPPAGRLALDGAIYEVSMTSGETPVNARAQWPTIEEFQVYVTRFLE